VNSLNEVIDKECRRYHKSEERVKKFLNVFFFFD
jgi:hypothetical protein